LHRHIDELASINNDMKNLLENTQIPMLFLDRQFRVRSFTPKMSELYHLLPSDTGLSILDSAPSTTMTRWRRT
jgi:two-component system, chemotaxis family, CheB/CheR fusion protein